MSRCFCVCALSLKSGVLLFGARTYLYCNKMYTYTCSHNTKGTHPYNPLSDPSHSESKRKLTSCSECTLRPRLSSPNHSSASFDMRSNDEHAARVKEKLQRRQHTRLLSPLCDAHAVLYNDHYRSRRLLEWTITIEFDRWDRLKDDLQ